MALAARHILIMGWNDRHPASSSPVSGGSWVGCAQMLAKVYWSVGGHPKPTAQGDGKAKVVGAVSAAQVGTCAHGRFRDRHSPVSLPGNQTGIETPKTQESP